MPESFASSKGVHKLRDVLGGRRGRDKYHQISCVGGRLIWQYDIVFFNTIKLKETRKAKIK